MKSIFTKSILAGTFFMLYSMVFGQFEPKEPDPGPKSVMPEIKTEQGEPVYDAVDEPAEFPGGLTGMREFLKANFKYPERAEELGLQGKCYLKLTIWKTGEIKEVKVKKGVVDCPECDQEAIRLVRLMPKWLPGKVNGAAVNSYFMLPVSFKVN